MKTPTLDPSVLSPTRRARSNTTPVPPKWQSACPSDSNTSIIQPTTISGLPHPAPPRRSPINQIRHRFGRPSLKREATSPVYLDQSTVALASLPSRRVAQCAPTRIRASDSDVASISSQDDIAPSSRASLDSPPNLCSTTVTIGAGGVPSKEKDKEKKRRSSGQRNKWTKEETEALVRGCNTFAIGQWKAIRDSEPILAKRSPGDLKDRFRTYFPDAYRKHYPNAKTHISTRVRSIDSEGKPIFGENAVRKERRQFSAEEDKALRDGYTMLGSSWTQIRRDPVLASRKATDLRDRFRNAFPNMYASAGCKARSRKVSESNVYEFLGNPPMSETHGTFEAIDLSVYPSYSMSTRNGGFIRSEQYQPPSLDFLKAHGADAFKDSSMMFCGGSSSSSSSSNQIERNNNDGDQFSFDDLLGTNQAIRAIGLAHLADNLTPRPDDTTPRPPRMTINDNNLEGNFDLTDQYRSNRILHKTQSSVDLTQFSNLHLVDSYLSHTTNATQHEHGYHLIDSLVSSGGIDFELQSSLGGCETSLSKKDDVKNCYLQDLKQEENQAEIEVEKPNFEEIGFGSNQVGSDWLKELEIASQTFPGAFDLNELSNSSSNLMMMMMVNQEARSSETSLVSSSDHHQQEEEEQEQECSSEDKVVYRANDRLSTSRSSHSSFEEPNMFFNTNQDKNQIDVINQHQQFHLKDDHEELLILLEKFTKKSSSSLSSLDSTLCPPIQNSLLSSSSSTSNSSSSDNRIGIIFDEINNVDDHSNEF